MQTDLFQELRGKMRGPLLMAADAGYDDARTIWNAMIDRRPSAIARCLGIADVIECIQFARKNQLSVCIKGGGHNIAGLAVANDSLLLDMSLMRGVWVDSAARIARAQAGCLLGDVDRETQVHGLASVQGFVSNTGIAGLTLGGGFGYLTRKYGWTSDTLLSAEVVTAEGKVVRASEKENSDLFWGLRGGGGNFGVVTNFEYSLYPLGPEVAAGAIAWPAEKALDVLALLHDFTLKTTNDTTCATALRIAPPAPWLDKAIHGKPIILIVCVHAGPVEDGMKVFSQLKSFGKPAGDIIQKRTYLSQQSLLDATQPKGRRYYWKSEYLPALNSDLLKGVFDHAQKVKSPHSAVILFQIGGALNAQAEDHSPVGNRDAKWVLNITGSWEQPSGDTENIEWARAAWRDLKRFSTGGTYINFLTEEEGTDRIAAAYGKHFERLARIKAKWDPNNLFRNNKNVPPASR